MRLDLDAVFVYGRLEKLPRARVSELLVNGGARLVGNPAQAASVVVAHRALDACVRVDGRLSLPFAVPDGGRLLSERALAELLAGPAEARPRQPYTLAEVARSASLDPSICIALALFDAIGDGERGFGYADLAAARQVAGLIGQGVAAPAVIRASWAVAAQGARLSQVRLAAAPWGGVLQAVAGRLARLDGQYALVLDEAVQSAAHHFEEALAREAAGELDEAERLYARAAQADRRDPLAAYNRGNVLTALGRDAEAMVAFQQALARDPGFAEATFNLAAGLERTGQAGRAVALYRTLAGDHPDYAQAFYNLARLLTKAGDFAAALPFWERFIALSPQDPDLRHAQRGALLCRMELRISPR